MSIIHDFYNQSELSKYPFADDATLIGTIGGNNHELKVGSILDISITSLYNDIYIQSIVSQQTTITINIYSQYAGYLTNIILSKLLELPTTVYIYSSGITGSIVFGENIRDLYNVPEITFEYNATKLVQRCIRMDTTREIESIVFINSNEEQTELSGDITLSSGYSTVITFDQDNNEININAEVGSGIGEFCGEDCGGDCGANRNIISINGVTPKDGIFYLDAKNYAVINNVPSTNSIVIGTAIPPERIDCTRTGTKGPKGFPGPSGQTGDSGVDAEPICIVCDPCNACDGCNVCDSVEYIDCPTGDPYCG